MARRSGAATIAQVALHARVSPATVSRVMNGNFLGEPEIAERVRSSAVELSYSPNHLARSLALGETRTIAFVVPDLANPTFQTVLAGLSKTAARDGYRVLVADSAESPADEPLLATEIRRRCDSIVLCAPRMPEDDLVDLAQSLSPLVLINRSTPRVSAPSLSVDYRTGIQNLAQHLYDLGHRRLAYLQGPTESVSNANRVRGLTEFEGSVQDATVQVLAGGVSSDEGYARAADIIRSGATGVLAFNDLVAVGLMNGLAELGVRVPADISVAGFDDIPFARYTAPTLTTSSVPHEELGVQSWSRLRALIRGERPSHDIVFQPRLELRGSTAPVTQG